MHARPASSKNMDKLFFDTNVLLDIIDQRTLHLADALACLRLVRSGQAKGAITALSLSDMAYICRQRSGILSAFQTLRTCLAIAPLTDETVDAVLASPLKDFEDSLQWQAAHQWGASHVLTRNTKDFPKNPQLPVLSPAQYLESRQGL